MSENEDDNYREGLASAMYGDLDQDRYIYDADYAMGYDETLPTVGVTE